MKKILARAIAAAVSLAFAGIAQAVPMYFDFTGTVLDTGAAISGGFNFESDRMVPLGPDGSQSSFIDWQPADVTDPLAFLNFDGQTVSIPQYAVNYSMVTFLEGCPGSCSPALGEFFYLAAYTNELLPADGIGTLRNDSISIFAFGDGEVDYFNGDTATPTGIVNLPLYNLLGSYYQNVATCVADGCTYTDVDMRFSIDTVTRGIGPRSVPEPGTLGLFGAALAGLFFVRRRTTSALSR
jgi:hypothetical protein